MQHPESDERHSLTELKDFYVTDGADVERESARRENVPEHGTPDSSDNKNRYAERTFERDLGPLGKAEFLRGEFLDDPENPNRGKRYEVWRLPGELKAELGDLGEVTLTRVRTGFVHEADAKGGGETTWGDGEVDDLDLAAPDLSDTNSKYILEGRGKTTRVYELDGGRRISHEHYEDGRPDHWFERREFSSGGRPNVTLELPALDCAPGGERPLETVTLIAKRLEYNLDPDAPFPRGRVKFELRREGDADASAE